MVTILKVHSLEYVNNGIYKIMNIHVCVSHLCAFSMSRPTVSSQIPEMGRETHTESDGLGGPQGCSPAAVHRHGPCHTEQDIPEATGRHSKGWIIKTPRLPPCSLGSLPPRQSATTL